MARLLAMYQQMRLIREKNQVTFDLTRFSSKYDRVSKNIEKVQKMYASKIAKLDQQATLMKNNASIFFRNKFNLGTNDFNLNAYSYNGLNGYTHNAILEIMKKGGHYGIPDGNGGTTPCPGMEDENRLKQMMLEFQQNGGRFIPAEDPNNPGKTLQDQYKNGWSKDEVNAFYMAKQMADWSFSNAQNNCSTVTQAYQNDVSIWLEAEKERLEAEQDAALAPLNYEETMWELEKNLAEQKLERIKAELDSYKNLLSEETKESAPKFGLG